MRDRASRPFDEAEGRPVAPIDSARQAHPLAAIGVRHLLGLMIQEARKNQRAAWNDRGCQRRGKINQRTRENVGDDKVIRRAGAQARMRAL
jgi:hypothetical protein